MDKMSRLSIDEANYPACFDTIKTFIDVKPFDQFTQEATGEKAFDFMSRGMSDIGLAIKYNGANIAPAYNTLLEELQQKMPEVYHYMIEKGYDSIAQAESQPVEQ